MNSFTHRLQRSFKPRFAIIYPFAFFFLFFCGINPDFLNAGLGFIMAGVLIRLWANGYAIKNDKLTTSGPYAFVRNPLYLGTFLIAIGFVVILKSEDLLLERIIGAIFLFGLSYMYFRTIKGEQGMLLTKFNGAYQNYCRHVPAMVPCLMPYKGNEKWAFSADRLLKSKEHKAVFWIFVLLVIFQIKTLILIEHKGFNQETWDLVAVALILIILDVIFELNKKKIK